jgi:pantetheine-phosphate adenylyltransferase
MIPIYAGTFGHTSVIKRMVKVFGRGIVLLATNPDKDHMFTGEQRQQLIKEAVEEIGLGGKVGVSATFGYVADWAKELFPNDAILVRGIRGNGDLEYEMRIAAYNRSYGIDTVFLPAEAGYLDISSSKLKEYLKEEKWEDIDHAAPRCVRNFLTKRMYGKSK